METVLIPENLCSFFDETVEKVQEHAVRSVLYLRQNSLQYTYLII